MENKARTNVRNIWVAVILIFIALLTSCQPKSSKPFPDLKEWDLLIISSSFNWGVGQYYAKLIEADMNVKVNLHDYWVSSLSIGSILKTLQSGSYLSPYLEDQSCLQPWSDLIKEAEVMVLYGNPLDSKPPDGSWDIPENSITCIMGDMRARICFQDLKLIKTRC